jgi:hypothetical protein
MDLPKKQAPKSVRDQFPIEDSSTSRADALLPTRDLTGKNILINSIDEYFQKETVSKRDIAEALGDQYWGSEYQKKQYENYKTADPLFQEFILKNFGSYDNFEKLNGFGDSKNIYDPYTDFKLDVTIITRNKFYKTDHISPFEVIAESLNGLCTVDYLKVNGSASKITGTLYKKYINPAQIAERANFFRPLAGNRIVLWDVIKQDWSSFYMAKAIRFVRDDTTGLE